ncbi:MAG: hypothetical protein QGH66_00035 [Dehalococcoidia bacterium]|nr:hypothetical protein [Dehalococcoidia bacterium]MDP7469841.1 hypothetical protein [Dehalococcoidia bacterium]
MGMVIIEHTMVDLRHGRVILKQFSIDHDRYIHTWAQVAKLRRHGTAAVI